MPDLAAQFISHDGESKAPGCRPFPATRTGP